MIRIHYCLLKNILQEWGIPVLVGVYLSLFSYFGENIHFHEKPPQDLGRVDKFNMSSTMIVYTPVSNITQQIMNKTAAAPFMKGKCINGINDKSCCY
jgi:hypothetical protein